MRAGIFREMGGYRDLFMEDLDFSQRLKKLGRTKVIPLPLITSGRRFLTWGPWRALSFILWVLFLHSLRLDTQHYAGYWDAWGGRSLNRNLTCKSDPAVLVTGAGFHRQACGYPPFCLPAGADDLGPAPRRTNGRAAGGGNIW